MGNCQYTYNILQSITGSGNMIVFDNLWKTMKNKGVSQYKLIKEFGISTGQLDRLRKNENVNIYTLNTLCSILDCNIEDIATYVKDESNEQHLENKL